MSTLMSPNLQKILSNPKSGKELMDNLIEKKNNFTITVNNENYIVKKVDIRKQTTTK